MATTTKPVTEMGLHEYQEFVRKQAFEIQAEMGWADDKLNATLRALGLPEKLVFDVPMQITATGMLIIRIDDANSLDEAKARVAALTGSELAVKAANAGFSTGSFVVDKLTATAVDAPDMASLKVGDIDMTIANTSIAKARRAAGQSRTMCEDYTIIEGLSYYCTKIRGHDEAQHAFGNGTSIVRVWGGEAA